MPNKFNKNKINKQTNKLGVGKNLSENAKEAKACWSKSDMEVYEVFIKQSDLAWLDSICLRVCVCVGGVRGWPC